MVGFFFAQSEYSLLDNTIKLEVLVKKVKEYGYSFLALSDNNMSGVIKFIDLCNEYQIKPIIGLKIDELLLYAKNQQGYENLLIISTIKETKNFISIEELHTLNQGIIAVSYTDNLDVLRYLDVFDDFYVGITAQHNYDLMNAAREKKIEILPLSRTAYLDKNQKIVYKYLRLIDGKESLNGDFYLRTIEELKKEFTEFPEVFSNLSKVLSKINFSITQRETNLPKFNTPSNIESKKYLFELCQLGLKKRLKGKVLKNYQDRLEYELQVITKMKYEDYFLIVWDFVKYAKNKNILVGPGRGSSAGSLVSYCLGITNVDPLEYNLLFERFLNPERISMPDIDLDFPDDKREEVIQYVYAKYGKDHVCYISTFNRFQARMSIRDLARVMNLSKNKLDETIKYIDANLTLTDNLKNPELIRLCEDDEIKELLKIAIAIEGLPKNISTHAAGIILSDEKLTKNIALTNGLNGMYQSQLEAADLEKLGLLKMDFLGLRNLSIINEIITKIPSFNLNSINLNDEKTYKLLASADTEGVFQLESQGIKNVLTRLKPEKMEDIIAVLALYRPGPMDQIDDYIKRKNGEKFSYLHQDLEPILKDTYGIIVYQEQIMRIAHDFAGFKLGEADILRRAVSKKQPEILKNERKKFVTKSIQKGYLESEANNIYDYIVKFANYGFNRNHSVPYALIAYQMAYLKANYSLYFYNAILSSVIGSMQTTNVYLNEAKLKGIKILPPSINQSSLIYKNEQNKIRLPLTIVSSIGTIIANKIISERENGYYKSYPDFLKRTSVNEKVIEGLVFSGAFDEFGLTKKEMIEQKQKQLFIKNIQDLSIKDLGEYDDLFLMEKEKDFLGLNLKYDPLIKFQSFIKKNNLITLDNVNKLSVGTKVKSIGFVKNIKIIKTKHGENMMFFTLSDGSYSNECVIFSNEYDKLKNSIKYGIIYAVEMTIDMRNEKKQFVISKMEMIDNA